jgi:pimeloyl-ACP methyl ester carboxylesterase
MLRQPRRGSRLRGPDRLSTPAPLAESYFERISAPVTRMAVIEQAGHFALVTHTGPFIAALRELLGR